MIKGRGEEETNPVVSRNTIQAGSGAKWGAPPTKDPRPRLTTDSRRLLKNPAPKNLMRIVFVSSGSAGGGE